MSDKPTRALVLYDPDNVSWGPDYGLRYTMDEVEALRICRGRFKEMHRKYHKERRELTATVSAISVRLLNNEAGQIKLLNEPQFREHPPRKFEGPRDLFRVVWMYVTKEDPKLASKYAKVIWRLYEAKVHPEAAADLILRSGGIEKVAQFGLYTPPYMDPRDIGDGMDADGNKIWYREEIKPKTVQPEPDEEEVRYRSEQQIFDFVGNAEADHGTVHVVMEYTKTKRGPLLEVVKVEGSKREIVPVMLTDYQSDRLHRVTPGKRARITVRLVPRPDRTFEYLATRVHPVTPFRYSR
jgi:hypothetical protein